MINETRIGEVWVSCASASLSTFTVASSFFREEFCWEACVLADSCTHLSAPEFTSFLSQTLPSPLLCDLGEQTFCTTHYNMIRSFHSMVDNREFYICLCIFFLPVNTLILLSCIYLYSPPILLPEGNVFRIWAVRCH